MSPEAPTSPEALKTQANEGGNLSPISTPPTLDEDRFRYTENLFKGMKDGFYGGVVDPFLLDITQKIGEIRAALSAKDAEATYLVAHSIKGAARNLGFVGLASAAANLEMSAKKWLMTETPSLFLVLEEEFARIRVFIDARRNKV